MTQESGTDATFRLRMLGTAEITDQSHQAVTALRRHPRRLAILFVLEGSGEGVMSRDQLAAMFWPNSSLPSSRTALRQSLHVIREHLGDVLSAIGNHYVAIQKKRVHSDLAEFRSALAAKRWNDAVDAYAGDLLEGFSLRGAPLFDEWMTRGSTELRLLARSAARAALEQSERSGSTPAVLSAARRALRLAPTDETVVSVLVRAHRALGDVRAAREAGQAFLLQCRHFGIEPSREITSTLASLQAV